MPLLAESEKGRGRAESSLEREIEMWCGKTAKFMTQSDLERSTLEGDSPVEEMNTRFHKRVGPPGLGV